MNSSDEHDLENSDHFKHVEITADPGQQLLRIDKFLNDRLEASRNQIQNALKAGSILVNQLEVKPNYKVRALDQITVIMGESSREVELLPENIPVNIVFEDDDLIVINKTPNMVVHPGYGNYTGTLVNALMFHFNEINNFENSIRPGLVHRIDKDTTGLMVVAKNEVALNNLAKQFFNRTVDRKYVAVVWGDVKEDEGTIVGNIGRGTKDRKIFQVYEDEEVGKHAVTHFKVLERFSYITVVECKLETGRTHQIRVHLKHLGHPLFGDVQYGGNKILKGTTFSKYKKFVENCFNILPRQALHAKTLSFIHPKTKNLVKFDSDLPEDISMVLDKWRVYLSGRNDL